jgi:uncharacterized protein (TIGR02246 family)
MFCKRGAVAMRNLLLPFLLIMTTSTFSAQPIPDPDHVSDRIAINAMIVDRFIAGWNAHDAHMFGTAFAEDADFTNWRGVSVSGRDNIEQLHAQVFQKLFMHSHETAAVKKIRFLKPDIAVVDVGWEMTGAVSAEGVPIPYRTGLLALVCTSSAGRWVITVMHNLDLTTAGAPPSRK